jgi:hypothetical protein
MLWSIHYISVIFNKEIFNNYIFRANRRKEKESFVTDNSPNHNSFKMYVSGEVIKQIESSNETQNTNVSFVLNQTNKIKCTYTPNIEW